MVYTKEDYTIIEFENSENKVLKRSDEAFIPYECWDNRDWCEYAELAGIKKES